MMCEGTNKHFENNIRGQFEEGSQSVEGTNYKKQNQCEGTNFVETKDEVGNFSYSTGTRRWQK